MPQTKNNFVIAKRRNDIRSMGIKIVAALNYLSQSPVVRTNAKMRRAYNAAMMDIHIAAMAMGSQANWDSSFVSQAAQHLNNAITVLRPFKDAREVVRKANVMLGLIRQLSYTMGDETPGVLSVNKSKSTKTNSLTLATRRALNRLSTIGDVVQQIEQADLGQIQRSSPPNAYMMEIGAAQRELSTAYAALERAYLQVRKIARKAGEFHV